MLKIKSEFGQNVFKLITGTALAHVITFFVTPILTRMFSQQSIGELQIFISTVTTFGVVASLKFEMAIVLPKDDDEGNAIAVLSIFALFIFSMLLTILLAVFGKPILHFLNADALQPFLYFISLGVFLFGLWEALQYVLIRRKRFGILATNKIIQVAVTQLLAVFLGIFWQKTQILLFAQILGYGTAAAAILFLRPISLNVSFKRLFHLIRVYKKFPTINTAMVFLNVFSLQLPVFMLSSYFGPEIVALYAMANRLMNIPLFMVGRSVRQVYFQSASEAYHHGGEALLNVYKSTVKKIALFAFVPLFVVLVAGQPIAYYYLGTEYARAGLYMQILTFWMFFQFINSPISATFTIIDKQEFGFVLIVISLVVRFAMMYIFRQSDISMLVALSVSAGLFYLSYNVAIYYFIKRLVK